MNVTYPDGRKAVFNFFKHEWNGSSGATPKGFIDKIEQFLADSSLQYSQDKQGDGSSGRPAVREY